ncbi:MAG TPA: efflux RND transporter periplasmic adaptor subunit [Ginsengibacter sp.]|nr:efflux RND transporter periplasmic adaptor subunit [Ginsengibacter sp.]HRP17151.1 efflux RND transporter periplasmic adaptor subunit [Ginsengibacter sp.]HRP44713.1 efflux RND transporter periplasmic adaptor subunit [Ginsengibacter sp.]
MKRIFYWIIPLLGLIYFSCAEHEVKGEPGVVYTCPMPEDSVFSDKPGRCPKCGMDLVPMESSHEHSDSTSMAASLGFTCPMHPQVHSDSEGNCPVCGMKLERIKSDNEPLELSLEMLLKPANQAVVAQVPMVHMAHRDEDDEVNATGVVEYNPDYSGTVASRFSGRITRMYIRYRYQKITVGQPLIDVYSPDLVAAQNNLLFLLKQDAGNQSLINAAREKLLNMGMSAAQISQITRTGKSLYSVTVYSNRAGVIYENSTPADIVLPAGGIMPLALKEGMYVEKGQTLFSLFNPSKARITLQIPAQYADMVSKGNKARIIPEGNSGNDFRTEIRDLLPFYETETNTLSARIPFDNSALRLPVGSVVKAIIFTGYKKAQWLPEEAVFSLGMDKVVFVREQDGFVARKVNTGLVSNHLIQILDGLQQEEAVASNAGFLVDSESFIVTKK